MSLSRRELLRSGAFAAGALTVGPAFIREALAAPARAGASPYGPLGAPDANGIRLPQGFSSRVIARAGQSRPRHLLPMAGLPRRLGELRHRRRRLHPRRQLRDAARPRCARRRRHGRRVGDPLPRRRRHRERLPDPGRHGHELRGRPDPVGHVAVRARSAGTGQVWECDPTGQRAAVARPALGRFSHEAAAVEGEIGKHVYLTEDLGQRLLLPLHPSHAGPISRPACSRRRSSPTTAA